MSGTPDAVRIVMELIEETIGRIVLRDVEKFVEGKKTVMMDDTINVAVAEDDKADWNAMIDSERGDMWWIDGEESDRTNVADVETNDDEMKNDEVRPVNAKQDDKINVADGMQESDEMRPADAKEDDKIDVVMEENGENEKSKLEVLGYDRMNFNWKEVKPLYTGQSE